MNRDPRYSLTWPIWVSIPLMASLIVVAAWKAPLFFLLWLAAVILSARRNTLADSNDQKWRS